jgi:hypothetical protein
VGHVVAPELPSQEGRVRSHGTRDSTGAHIVKEATSGAEGHVAAGAHLSKEVRSGAVRHVVTLEPTSIGRCALKLQLAWQRVDAHSAHWLHLELVCEGTQFSGYR